MQFYSPAFFKVVILQLPVREEVPHLLRLLQSLQIEGFDFKRC